MSNWGELDIRHMETPISELKKLGPLDARHGASVMRVDALGIATSRLITTTMGQSTEVW
jgi:hypothetical protein